MTLLEMLPDTYQHSAEITNIENALNTETEKAQNAKDDLMLQLNVDTATWGLVLWERAYGLTTDISKSYVYRRSRIKSKMRATGTSTIAKIQNVSESFLNDEGNVDVLEYNPEYRFVIKYIETLGLPPNVDGLKAAVDEIKPAHLDYGIYFEDRVPGKLGIATVSKLGITLTLYPWQIHDYASISTVQTAAAMKSSLSVTVLERG